MDARVKPGHDDAKGIQAGHRDARPQCRNIARIEQSSSISTPTGA
jgi:hypothetical protein